jgi:hypothetical protein
MLITQPIAFQIRKWNDVWLIRKLRLLKVHEQEMAAMEFRDRYETCRKGKGIPNPPYKVIMSSLNNDQKLEHEEGHSDKYLIPEFMVCSFAAS